MSFRKIAATLTVALVTVPLAGLIASAPLPATASQANKPAAATGQAFGLLNPLFCPDGHVVKGKLAGRPGQYAYCATGKPKHKVKRARKATKACAKADRLAAIIIRGDAPEFIGEYKELHRTCQALARR